jgi:hypothetical protein
MGSLRKLERDYVSADLAAVENLIDRLTDEDVMARFGLEARRDELRQCLATLAPQDDLTASAAIFFGGRPVVGSNGIESEFAGNAVAKFQDLVAKLFAQQENGGLGQRGVVANKAATRLHITNIVRGSFGFLLEDVSPQGALVETSLKIAVDAATRLLGAFAEDDEERFQAEVETVDQRVLTTAREFFELMRQDAATFRLVVGETDKSFGLTTVERASERAVATRIEDVEEHLIGRLSGILPEGHLFEFRSNDERGVVRGKVDKALSVDVLADYNRHWIDVDSVAHVKVRRILHDGVLRRESLTLVEIGAPAV